MTCSEGARSRRQTGRHKHRGIQGPATPTKLTQQKLLLTLLDCHYDFPVKYIVILMSRVHNFYKHQYTTKYF